MSRKLGKSSEAVWARSEVEANEGDQEISKLILEVAEKSNNDEFAGASVKEAVMGYFTDFLKIFMPSRVSNTLRALIFESNTTNSSKNLYKIKDLIAKKQNNPLDQTQCLEMPSSEQ